MIITYRGGFFMTNINRSFYQEMRYQAMDISTLAKRCCLPEDEVEASIQGDKPWEMNAFLRVCIVLKLTPKASVHKTQLKENRSHGEYEEILLEYLATIPKQYHAKFVKAISLIAECFPKKKGRS